MTEGNNHRVDEIVVPKLRMVQRVHCVHHQKESRYEIILDDENLKLYIRCLECPKPVGVIAEFALARGE